MVRAKLAAAGVLDPLREMTLHQLLDYMEFIAVEGKVNAGGDALERFYYELYKPDEDEVKRLMKEEDTDSGFDNFAALGMQ